MSRRKLPLAVFMFTLGVFTVATRAEDDARSQVLSLVSLEYRLDGRDTPRSHDIYEYLPFLNSADADVLEVAALSVVWEEYAIEQHRSFRERIGAVEGLLAGLSPRPPGAAPDADTDFEAQQREFKARMVGPLQQAIKQGALAAYQKANILASASRGFDLGMKDSVANIIQAQANDYGLQAQLGEMQDILWTRAEALAKSGAKSTSFEEGKVAVTLRIERGRGFMIVVQNKSAHDLHHVTLSATAKKAQVGGATPGQDKALGALGSVLSGEEDAAEIEDSANTFAKSTKAYYSVRNRPTRIFLHAAAIPAGKELSTIFVSNSMEMARSEPGTFSLWSDKGSIEGQAIGGMDELRAEMKKNAANNSVPPNRRPSQPGSSTLPLFGGGASGNATRTQAGMTRTPSPAFTPRVGGFQATNPAEMMLSQANLLARTDLMRAAPQFREIITRFPKSNEATEAKSWLDCYPQHLLDRASALPDNPRSNSQAILLYKEVLASKSKGGEASTAKQALDELAAKLLASAMEFDDAGNKSAAMAIYTQIARDLPKSKEATTARARLRKGAATKGR